MSPTVSNQPKKEKFGFADFVIGCNFVAFFLMLSIFLVVGLCNSLFDAATTAQVAPWHRAVLFACLLVSVLSSVVRLFRRIAVVDHAEAFEQWCKQILADPYLNARVRALAPFHVDAQPGTPPSPRVVSREPASPVPLEAGVSVLHRDNGDTR